MCFLEKPDRMVHVERLENLLNVLDKIPKYATVKYQDKLYSKGEEGWVFIGEVTDEIPPTKSNWSIPSFMEVRK